MWIFVLVYHAEVEVPEPLPADAAMWVEIEANQGQKQLGSLEHFQIACSGIWDPKCRPNPSNTRHTQTENALVRIPQMTLMTT